MTPREQLKLKPGNLVRCGQLIYIVTEEGDSEILELFGEACVETRLLLNSNIVHWGNHGVLNWHHAIRIA